ncbi:GNAT family N-acetyltransferase [Heyndrickxia sporothermodurans]|nr:GNAT family N-acetyltransferase [Heyndrickxia sporothermodurans]MEB6551107.1 GNAT family N-acetyltransferase [Heyndrickxia sporothermodurans]MED3651254.1 GNAT family N-acetyltransferase [Heyndrickxia sporothermodurans]MED3654636.1 GNAT family N-acetyltransferase [Heyndrickxia sporothermodurans]MED3699919.1 GNAT family N-acetyltransferase [Heyndrickxia sporothermodurans]MED3781526.1 GNAT family N-acetyltransferase [Heyndrickxia sporothermodurans]
MKNSNFYFTSRILRIMRNAEIEMHFSKDKVLQPVHLLIACLNEKTGVLGEISLKTNIDKSLMTNRIIELRESQNQNITGSDFFNTAVTVEVIEVFHTARHYMEKYNQVYLNEGHLLKALITTGVMDSFLTDENKEIILALGTNSRDMITHLGKYTYPNVDSPLIRRAISKDENNIVNFVDKNFSKEWSQTIRAAFLLDDPSIYIAYDNYKEIIGFAAFDIYKNRKCYFGPMGVTKSNRVKGIGYALLHHCLKDMKEIGYEYAVIGEAGPIEFYEKACNAVVIPSM